MMARVQYMNFKKNKPTSKNVWTHCSAEKPSKATKSAVTAGFEMKRILYLRSIP